jgi:hypothetical protein
MLLHILKLTTQAQANRPRTSAIVSTDATPEDRAYISRWITEKEIMRMYPKKKGVGGSSTMLADHKRKHEKAR